jgi:hypothetical protein
MQFSGYSRILAFCIRGGQGKRNATVLLNGQITNSSKSEKFRHFFYRKRRASVSLYLRCLYVPYSGLRTAKWPYLDLFCCLETFRHLRAVGMAGIIFLTLVEGKQALKSQW